MKKVFFILFLLPLFCQGQLVSLIFSGDTLKTVNPSTGTASHIRTGANQPPLVSGTNIKTINGSTVLGSGDLVVGGTDATKLAILNNLSDLNNAGTARTNLGLGNVTNESKATMFTNPVFTGTFTTVAGSIANAALANSAVANLSGTNTGDQNTVTGNAGSATVLQTSRNINGVAFNGSADITVTAAAGTVTGATLAAGVTGSSLTTFGAAATFTTTGNIGYATGAGGTVTQATSKTTAVTLNKISGQITMNNAALAAAAEVAFTLTNSTIAATDVVIVNIQSVGTAGAYFVTVGAVAAGSCSITVGNVSAGSLSQALVLNFAVIKSVNN